MPKTHESYCLSHFDGGRCNCYGRYEYFNPNNPTGFKISRQRLYQLRKIKEDKCIICGKEKIFAKYCQKHRDDNNRRNRNVR